MRCTQFFGGFILLSALTFEMVLLTILTHGRISFDNFVCLPNPFRVLTPLVTEFVVSFIHDVVRFFFVWLHCVYFVVILLLFFALINKTYTHFSNSFLNSQIYFNCFLFLN